MSDSIITTATWLLLTVTNNGVVSTTQFPTEASCLDGISVAKTGRTVAENAKFWGEYIRLHPDGGLVEGGSTSVWLEVARCFHVDAEAHAP